MLIIKYNGRRFPRVIALQGHKKSSFLPGRTEIEFEDYDAYLLLRKNSRISFKVFEFNVVRVSKIAPEVELPPAVTSRALPMKENDESKAEPPKRKRTKTAIAKSGSIRKKK